MSVPYYGDFAEDSTVYIPFNTFDSNDPSASATVTNLLNTDVHIHKDGGLTQRNNAAGITMSVNFDGITGCHLLTIDTSDNTVAGFYVTGSEYQVRIEGITVDAAILNPFIGAFSIERAGGALALSKLIQAATITNAAGTDIAADIIAVKAETATILADTNELQTDNVPGLIATAQADLDIITGATGVNLLAATQASIDAIETDTGTTLPATLTTIEGKIDTADTVVDGIQADLSNATDGLGALKALIDALNDLSAADVNAQVLDVLNVDTFAEPGDEAPAATTTLVNKLGYLYKFMRNKLETTATRIHVYDDAGTNKDHSSIISDDGSTFTRGEFTAGDA